MGFLVVVWLLGAEPAIAPEDARQHVGKEVRVDMVVKASKDRLEKRGEIYLDSTDDFRDPKNLGVIIDKTGAAKFKEAGIADPAGHFLGKTIRVRGVVSILDERTRIIVSDPKQIRVLP